MKAVHMISSVAIAAVVVFGAVVWTDGAAEETDQSAAPVEFTCGPIPKEVAHPTRVDEYGPESSRFYSTESLSVVWQTRPEAIRELLPPPLEPREQPVVSASFTYNPHCDFLSKKCLTTTYHLAALFIPCFYKGEPGAYCVSMLEDDDIAVVTGREVHGYPKKMATLHYQRSPDSFEGWVERRGIRVFSVRAKLTEVTKNEPPPTEAEWDAESGRRARDPAAQGGISWLIKCTSSPEGGYDFAPRLNRQPNIGRTFFRQKAEILELNTAPSPYDSPWARLEIVKVLNASFAIGHRTMIRGHIVAELDPASWDAYSGRNYDF